MRLGRLDRILTVRQFARALLLFLPECRDPGLEGLVRLLPAERLNRLFKRFGLGLQRGFKLLGARAALLDLALEVRGGPA